MAEVFNIKITMNDRLDHYREEDIVKNLWGSMYPFFTRRHGTESITIDINKGNILIECEYQDTGDMVENLYYNEYHR